MIEYRKATPDDLECIWNMNIADNPDDPRWIEWKREYIAYNQSGMAATYVVCADRQPIGEGTLLFSPQCKAVRGRLDLADQARAANINALRIRKAYEGKGYISALVKMMEHDALSLGYTRLTIGVEAGQARNLAIYLHWGYDRFLCSEFEDEALVLYYEKKLK